VDGKDNGSRDNDPYDGVVYESTRKLGIRVDSPNNRKKRQAKNNMAAFYILTLVIAIVLCMIIFAVVFQSVLKPAGTGLPAASTSPASANTPISIADLTSCSGVIQTIDPSGTWVDILDVSTDTTYHLIIWDTTKLLDKTGAQLVFGEFGLGEIVEAEYNAQTGDTDTLKRSPNAWIIRERDNLKIDLAARTITFGNDKYSYNENLITLHHNQRFSLDLLQPMDVLTVTGIGSMAWSVTLVTGHGSLYITNANIITDGALEIDNDQYRKLDDPYPVYLPEGSHHIVVKGANIETYIKDIVIEVNKSEYVSLGDVKIKSGWLNVQVNVQDYTIYIDGEEKTPNQPVNLMYGDHVIRVEKEDYVTKEQTVTVDDLSSTVEIVLNPVLRLGKIIANSVPQGAKVYVDSVYIGDTPVSRSIEMGEHTLLVTMDGYMSISFPVNIDRDTEPYNDFTIELLPEQTQTYNPFLPPEQRTKSPYPTQYPTENSGDPTLPTEFPAFSDLPAVTSLPWPLTDLWPSE
jgi:hypothetical protein